MDVCVNRHSLPKEAQHIRSSLAGDSLMGFAILTGAPPRVAVADRGASELFGRVEGGGIEGHVAHRLTHPDERNRLISVYEECLREPGRVRSVSFSAMLPDGSTRDLMALATGCRFEGENAMAVGLLDQGRSWEERTSGNREEALYRSLVENAFDAIYMLEDKHYVYVNPRFCEITGYDFDELTDPDFNYEVLLPGETSDLIESRYRARSSGEEVPGGYTVEIIKRSGQRALVDVSTVSLADEPGEVRVLGIMRDVTERERARRELRESRRFLESILSNVPGMVFRCHNSPDWRMDFVSPGARDLTGYIPGELVENEVIAFGDLILPNDRQRVWESVQAAVRSEEKSYSLSYRIRHRNGSVRHVWEHGSIIPGGFEDECSIEGIISDVTEIRRTTERYAASQSRLEAIIKSMHDILFVFDRRGRFIHYYAPEDSQLLMSPSEFLGRHYSEVLPADLAEKMDAAFRISRGGQVTDFEYSLDLGEGTRHYMARLSPLVEEGEFAGVISVSRDITSIVEAERQRMKIQEELQRAQKLESMGIMAGGVAHDFNNLLEGIIGQVDLALAEEEDGSRLGSRLARIRNAASRASELSDKMLAYSGKGGKSLQNVDLKGLLKSIERFLKSAISSDSELVMDLCDDPAWVVGDASQLQQVVLNLVMNASEALEGRGGRITISLGRMDMDRSELAATYVNDDLCTGSYVRMTVSDNGCGMDEQTVSRAFDPFFTTKFTGRGLGLASVLGIVRGHGGAVSLDSTPQEGSTVAILLPEASEDALSLYSHAGFSSGEVSVSSAFAASMAEASDRILVVDDERIILDTASELLSHMGYGVETASSGEAAVDLLRSDESETIGLVLLDVTMPGMDGLQTLRLMRDIRPDIQVVVSSGYAKEEIMPRFMEIGVSGFLHKPYSLKKLAEALEDAGANGEGERKEQESRG